MFKVIRNHTVTDIIFFLLPKVKNATSYFKNGLKNRFRAIAIRADEHFPNKHLSFGLRHEQTF